MLGNKTDYSTPFTRIAVGDIVHATAPNGASLICLIVEVTETVIRARTVTTQFYHDFDRKTGFAEWRDDVITGGRQVPCTIDSIEPLPVEVHNILLGLDRKSRLTLDWRRAGLSDDEKRALDFVYDFYPANLIADANPDRV